MALRILCPNCGSRPYTEFECGGELVPRPAAGDGPDEDFERVWLRANVAGVQTERWFHSAGCRRWLTVQRDTITHQVHGVV